MTITVSIVEEEADVRAAVASLIDFLPGYACVSQHANTESALHEIPRIAPDVTLDDMKLPGWIGMKACARSSR